MLQAPSVHAAVPLVPLHTVPQVPQLVRLLLVLVSQPSEYWPLQSAYGFVQLATAHVVPTQDGVPFCTAHTLLQLPQAFTLLVVEVSQPLLTLASQLP